MLLLVLLIVLLAKEVTVPVVEAGEPLLYAYNVVKNYPHDKHAFTQGLQYDIWCNLSGPCTEIFWESTGLNGRSSVRRVELETGAVLVHTPLEHKHFGEGVVRLGEFVYQLTWQFPTSFKYEATTLRQVEVFSSGLKDGWGLTTDGTYLIISDGSNKLTWLDPSTYKFVKTVDVTDAGRPVTWLNELEWIEGEIWANIWQTECIARIRPDSGQVVGWAMMHGLREIVVKTNPTFNGQMDVLNGIAYDKENERIFLTGKLWPAILQIQLTPENRPRHTLEFTRKVCIKG